jgi:hypothetical protein
MKWRWAERRLKKYDPADFKLNKNPIRLSPEPKGLEITSSDENRLIVKILDRNFSLHVTGFDENRDLYVRIAVPKEDTHGDSPD